MSKLNQQGKGDRLIDGEQDDNYGRGVRGCRVERKDKGLMDTDNSVRIAGEGLYEGTKG